MPPVEVRVRRCTWGRPRVPAIRYGTAEGAATGVEVEEDGEVRDGAAHQLGAVTTSEMASPLVHLSGSEIALSPRRTGTRRVPADPAD